MSGRYGNPDYPSDIAPLLDRLDKLERRLSTLEAPDGNQLYQTVERLSGLINDIQAQLDDYIANGTYNKAQLDAKFADINATTVTAGVVTSTGSVSAAGAIQGATGKFDVGLYSLDARNFVVATNYAASWIDINGHFGISPSSRRFKRDITTWEPDLEAFLSDVRPVRYHDDLDQPLGFDGEGEPLAGPHELGPWRYGFIAEELADAGFEQFTFADAEGRVLGINYDRLTVALFAVAQQQADRLDQLEQRLDKAGL